MYKRNQRPNGMMDMFPQVPFEQHIMELGGLSQAGYIYGPGLESPIPMSVAPGYQPTHSQLQQIVQMLQQPQQQPTVPVTHTGGQYPGHNPGHNPGNHWGQYGCAHNHTYCSCCGHHQMQSSSHWDKWWS
ncbi:hypothetical protein [Pseudalkalibacillus sp. SCS-8]|uniref:hypothetical protein n=1 Tax=Pseudalkalibacillus nanhaiensis TaxID=3115291 RepID=UPI0032DAEECA